MTATLDPEQRQYGTAIGPRERRRLEQARRSRRRRRRAAAVAVAVVVAVAGVVGMGIPLLDSAPRQPPEAPAGEAEAPAGEAEAPAGAADAPAGAADAPAGAAEAPAGAAEAPVDERVRVQLLNGVGAPGVADRVEERLPDDEFRVVVADNAPEFGVARTRLLVYDDDPVSLAAAGRLRDLLGAGTISVSRQPQSVVDVTVIIGLDVDEDS